MTHKEQPNLVYRGKHSGFMKAEPSFEHKAVEQKPSLPGAEITKLTTTDLKFHSNLEISAIVTPNGKIIFATKDGKTFSSEVNNEYFDDSIKTEKTEIDNSQNISKSEKIKKRNIGIFKEVFSINQNKPKKSRKVA